MGASREPETTVQIRPERPDDVDVIDRLTTAAFEPQWFSDGSEAPIVRALRASGDLTLSLVAEDDGDVIGHVAFSPVTIDGSHDGWFGLGPISVRLDRQRRGIGRALVAEGLRRLRAREARGCALIGDYDFSGYHENPNAGAEGTVLTGTFVGGGVRAGAAGIELTGQITWHGKVQSAGAAEGIELTGGLR